MGDQLGAALYQTLFRCEDQSIAREGQAVELYAARRISAGIGDASRRLLPRVHQILGEQFCLPSQGLRAFQITRGQG